MNTGTKVYRNYFPIKFGWQCDCKYGHLYPCFRKIMYPGDVFKIHADLLIRYQPMLTPPMNDCVATVRFAFVPLRLIEENTELVITGSKDGKLYTETLPVFDSVFKNLDIVNYPDTTAKHSLFDVLYGIPAGLKLTSNLLTKLEADKASPAAYFAKAYFRFWWDFYRDENLYGQNDFETFWQGKRTHLHTDDGMNVSLKKDRITSALPWQLKATAAPTIDIVSTGSITPNYGDFYADVYGQTGDTGGIINGLNSAGMSSTLPGYSRKIDGQGQTIQMTAEEVAAQNKLITDYLNQTQPVTIQNLGVSGAQIRDVMAETRIFERLARCGSRYTEYLHANFGIAPVDGTLQRAQYLGGFKTRIVTTEVIQTAADGQNPVGTLRGHGITHGTSTIKPFMAKEIGVIIGVLDIKPETIYAQGVDRELTARTRFDFLNPSFQHLSEQEVRKGEVYFDIDTDSSGNLVNGQTWGFQPYAQELRTGVKHVVGDMRDSLAYWNQSLILSSRPSLNNAFIDAGNHTTSFNRPFAVSGANAFPMIVDFGGVIEAYRPLVKNGTPGLTDHN